jgi:DTW domain-containing protein YfiP
LLAQRYCTCEFRVQLSSNTAFLLLMYGSEVLKPSNSGRLIADLIPQTHAYLWQRTSADPQMLALLDDPQYQPFVIFPSEYAQHGQQVIERFEPADVCEDRTPLFVLLDGSWRQAVKMFNKSTYLHRFPVLSFTPETAARYGLRKGKRDFQLGTAEVAAMALEARGEEQNAKALSAWFDLFVESSIYGRTSRRVETLRPLDQLQSDFVSSCNSETEY